MINFFKRFGIYFIFIIVIGLFSIISILYNDNSDKESIAIDTLTTEITYTSEKKFYVDIKGSIKKPGVYEVSEGMIINDVIKMAGGIKNNGYLKNINLSKKVVPEMVIYIYSKSEIKTTNSTTSIILNDALYTTTVPIITNEIVSDNSNTLVNINTASKEELMKIAGIGSSKADQIILYRNNTPFLSIEDIKKVSGIGESLYESIKDSITV